MAFACNRASSFERLSEARRLSADLLVQFTKAQDAANRAVMADTDEASVAFAKEAEDSKKTVQKNVDALRPLLQDLGYADETRTLQEFTDRFAAYGELDRRILDLAVENTNLKAQRLSFGEAQKAADTFTEALEDVTPLLPAAESWRGKALVASAISDLRAIQVAQAPHIAEADDAAMTRIEQRMTASEEAVRGALTMLASMAPPSARPRLAAATAALDAFMKINSEIVALSRRNTNVRSLALSLNDKGKSISACDASLHALQDALAKRGVSASR